MAVIDSSAWIAFFLQSSVGARVRAVRPTRRETLALTNVQLELMKWASRERPEIADAVLADINRCFVIPLATTLAEAAASLYRFDKLATADAIIDATAQSLDADLLTCDKQCEPLAGVTYLAKPDRS